MEKQEGLLISGARRVWRHQRLLWWLFVANLVLAACGTIPVDRAVGRVADHSLYSRRLYDGFDLPAFSELAANPEVALWSRSSSSLLFAGVFFVFALFLTGGILETYRTDRRLPTGEFFHACGTFFWRWVRLLMFLLAVLLPIAVLASGITRLAAKLSNDAPQEKLGFWVELTGLCVVTLLMMTVRLWFDMAQVHIVSAEERSVLRSLIRGLQLASSKSVSLFWMYLRISFLGMLGVAVMLLVWARVPPTRIGTSFLLLEAALLWSTGIRLWQRASETVWYERELSVTGISESAPETSPAGSDVPPLPTAPPDWS